VISPVVLAIFPSKQTNDRLSYSQLNVESVTLTTKPLNNAVTESKVFLRRVCSVQNEITVINKFYLRKIRFLGTFYASFLLLNFRADSSLEVL